MDGGLEEAGKQVECSFKRLLHNLGQTVLVWTRAVLGTQRLQKGRWCSSGAHSLVEDIGTHTSNSLHGQSDTEGQKENRPHRWGFREGFLEKGMQEPGG